MSETIHLRELLDERFEPFHSAPSAMLVADSTGVIVYANQRLADTFEYPRETLVGSSVDALVPEDARSSHTELRQAYVEYPATRRMGASRDLYGVSRSGRRIPVEIGLTSFKIQDFDLTLAFVLDLTARKRQEDRFRAVTEAASHGLVMVDEQGRIVLVNGAACEMFGYEREQLVGQLVEALIPATHGLKHRVYRASYAQRTEVRRMGFGRDLYARRRDGSEFPVEVGLTPLDSDDGRFVVATVSDLTERKRAEDEMQESHRHLLRLNEELSGFSYSVSHDLKSPLASIIGLIDLAHQDAEQGDLESVKETLGQIRERGSHLGELVDDILNLARSDIESNRSERLNLHAIVRDVFASLEPFAEQRQVDLINEVPQDLSLLSQKIRLTQILENLVSNAVKYSCDHNGPRQARVYATTSAAEIEFGVADNGLGIPDEYREQVFGMFQRFHSDHCDGSGLGLSLVRKHVEAIGGSIEFESSSEGTTFMVSIPGTGDS